MKTLNRKTIPTDTYTERILQFGEGNFLRAFVDWIVHKMNKEVDFDAGVVVIQPIENGLIDLLNEQEGLYSLYLNGIKNGKAVSEHELIDCIQRGINPYEEYNEYMANAENPNLRFIVSNTTEAGISYNPNDRLEDAPPKSFPGKLTAFLFRRFQVFKGKSNTGFIILPCELIDRNGDNLKRLVYKYADDWNLGKSFIEWIDKENIFCNTLVDRIVPGYPKDKIDAITKELGYKDNLIVEGEQFHLWVIEGPKSIQNEFPSMDCDLNVVFTNNLKSYRTRKVRILNGAHTSLVPVGYLYGIEKVRESIEDKVVGKFIKDAIFNEICLTLDLSIDELNQFSNDVLDRFRNPFLEHELMSISLNSISKYKTRVLPSVLEYIKRKKELPSNLVFSLAALIVFYKGERNGEPIKLKDKMEVLDFFNTHWKVTDNSYSSLEKLAHNVLSNVSFWEEDLSQIPGLSIKLATYLEKILNCGMRNTLKALIAKEI